MPFADPRPAPATSALPAAPPGTALTATLLFASTLTVMAGATISPALPLIEAEFADVDGVRFLVELMLTITAAAIALVAGIAGWLVDRIGARTMLVWAVPAYVLAGTSGLWLNELLPLLAGRIVLGLAVAAIMTATTASIGRLFHGEARGRLLGWQAAATAGGGLVFLLLGGLLADIGWRGPFAVYALAILLIPAVLVTLPRRRVAAGTRQANLGADADAPTRWAVVAGATAMIFLAGLAFYMVPTKLSFRLIEIGAGGGTATGLAIGISVVASAFAALAASRVAARTSRLATIGAGLGLLGAGLVGIGAAPGFGATLAALVVLGFGTGLAQPILIGLALGAASEAAQGRVAGAMTTAMFLGQFSSPIVSRPIEIATDLATTYQIVGAGCLVIALVVGALAFRGRKPAERAVA